MKTRLLILLLTFGIMQTAFSQSFYDINTINTVEITFAESNWDYLLDQLAAAGDEERLTGTASVNGVVFDSVGVRYKGNSSYNANQIKNPLNIKLDYIIDDQSVEGYGTLKLANVTKDPSFVREVLGYEIARKYFPASQSNFTNVYVNGTHLGLYTSDQSVDKFFMRTHFDSDGNTQVKGELTDAGGQPTGGVWEYYGQDSSSYYSKYEMRSDYGWNELIDLFDTLNNNNDYVDQLLNIDRHLWFLAFSNLIVNLDGPINNPQNYYLYKNNNGRFNPIPWDLNESFGIFSSHQTLGQLRPEQLQQLSPFANLNEDEFPIISKILSNDTYRKMYVAHMKTIIEENFENNLYETRALEIQDIIDADVQADQNKFYTYSDFTNNVNHNVGFGPQSVIGIVELMDARIEYIQALSDFQYVAPTIGNVTYSPEEVYANSEVFFTAEVDNADDVFLSYRLNSYDVFTKTLMYDDGLHSDGEAGDGIYGISIFAGATDMEYYIYTENQDAVAFSPERAEYEFYEISVICNITGDLVINEFMADNETTVADQDGDYDDWVELYNNGSDDINLEGYYLSDAASEPDQWTFPDTTIIAGGYLIIWTDKDEEQEGLHAGFKLSTSGESIVLSDNFLNLLDQIDFSQQKADTTTGRFENGTGDFIEMLPTFGTENTNTLTGIEEEMLSESSASTLQQNRPNPFRTTTTIDFSILKSENVVLNIMNSQGIVIKTLVSKYLSAGNYSYSWSANGLPKGLYFYSLSVGDQINLKKMMIQ